MIEVDGAVVDNLPAAEDSSRAFVVDVGVQELMTLVNGLVADCDARTAIDEGDVMEGMTTGGPMRATEISKLYRELLRVRDDGPGIGACPGDILLPLLHHVLTHIKAGLEINIIASANAALEDDRDLDLGDWMSISGEGSTLLQQTIMAIEAAAAALVILTANDIDRRLMMEEVMEGTVQLLKHQVHAHLIPAFDASASSLKQPAVSDDDDEPRAGRSGGGDDDVGDEDDDEDISRGGSTGSKRGKGKRKSRGSTGGKPAENAWCKPLLKHLMRTTAKTHELLDLLELLVNVVRVDDRLLLTLTPVCLATLTIDVGTVENIIKLQSVQQSAMGLLQTIFGAYEQHRTLILEDVFGLFLRLPSGKRNLRTFRLHYRAITLGTDGQNIQNITALVLLLLQSVVTKPEAQLQHLLSGGIGVIESARDKTMEGEHCVTSMAHHFARGFLERCGKKECGSEFRAQLTNLTDDLLMALLLPEWPAAEVLLQSICLLLLRDLYNTKSSGAEHMYFLQSLDLLGKVLSKLRELSQEADRAPEALSEALGQELKKAVEEGDSAGADGRVVLEWFRRLVTGRIAVTQLSFSVPSATKQPDKSRKKKKKGRKVSTPTPAAAAAAVPASDPSGAADGPIASRRRSAIKAAAQRQPPAEIEDDDDHSVKSDTSSDKEGTAPPVDGLCIEALNKDVAYQLVLNFLSHRADKGESWLKCARWLFIVRWIMDSAVDGIRHHPQYWSYLESQWQQPTRAMLQDDVYHCLPTEAVVRLSHGLALHRTLMQSFDKLLFRLLALIGQGQATWRARVMKAFANILECDPMLMAHQHVKQSVVDRFHDEATSVRQATVDLVGKYVQQRPQLFEVYYDALSERLVDKGVSVRKTVLKIFGEFLQRMPNHKLRTEICRRLVERASMVKEEDTVKDLIRATFHSMWFSDSSATVALASSAHSPVDAEDDAAEAARPAKRARLSDAERLSSVGMQMVEVIAGLHNTDWLVSLLSGLLFGPGEGEQQKKERAKQRKGIMKRCEAIVESLINVLLELDEGAATGLNVTIEELSSKSKQLLAVISTLFVFSRANPQFLLAHVDTLLPYLKGENHLDKTQDEASMCCMISQMVALVIPHLGKPDREKFAVVVKDLVQITYKFGPSAIHAAIQCLANICSYVTKDPAAILMLGNTFYKVLKKCQDVPDFSTESAGNRSSVHRGLVVLGCICRYYNFKALTGERLLAPPSKAGPLPKELTSQNVYEASYRVLSVYLTKDVETETKAIQAVCSLFTGCMQLMLTAQRDGIISRMMRSKADSVKLQALRSLQEVLLAEENRVESGAAREAMASAGVTLKQRVKGDQDAEASIVGGVIQEHIETIQQLLMDRDASLRASAVALLGVLHRQGLVNPLQTLPTLIALQGDSSSSVRADAYRQLLVENEKHPEFLPARLLDGVCLCYHFQRRALGAVMAVVEDKDAGTNNPSQCVIGPMYASCIRNNRKHRFAFLRNMLSLFEEKTARDMTASVHLKGADRSRQSSASMSATVAAASQEGSLDPAFLAFIAQAVAYLPYDVQEEPLFVIYHISRVVSLEGSALQVELRRLFARAGLLRGGGEGGGGEKNGGGDGVFNGNAQAVAADDSEQDDDSDGAQLRDSRPTANGGGVDDMEVDADAASPDQLSPGLLAELKDKCAAGMAYCVLLRLKFFLKQVYNLNDTRCLEYKPNEATQKTERPLSKAESLPDLDLPQNLVVNSSGDVSDVIRTLVLQYNEFRKHLKGDASDFKLHKVERKTAGRGRRSSAGPREGAPEGGEDGGGGRGRRRGGSLGSRGGRGKGRGRGRGGARKRVDVNLGESSSEDDGGSPGDSD